MICSNDVINAPADCLYKCIACNWRGNVRLGKPMFRGCGGVPHSKETKMKLCENDYIFEIPLRSDVLPTLDAWCADYHKTREEAVYIAIAYGFQVLGILAGGEDA